MKKKLSTIVVLLLALVLALSACKGTKGDTGETGLQGIRGETGDTGAAGQNGTNGVDGQNGTDGATPYIGANGHWWIGTADTGIAAQGAKGETGQTGAAGAVGQNGTDGIPGDFGLSAYRLYIKYHPEYTKTEMLWLDDLVSGSLAGILATDPNSTEGLVYTLSVDETYYVVSGYTGTATEIIISGGYYGKAVKVIWANAFLDKQNISTVSIPESVTSIGTSAFRGCTGLTEINYNATAVADFGEYSDVFSNAGTSGTGITVNVDANVTQLPAYMFYESSGSYSPKITSVNFAAGSALTSIGTYAFYGRSGLTSITLPASVTSIGDFAFAYCRGLTSITIMDSVTSIGTSAFSYCTGLTEINYNATAVADFGAYGPVFLDAGTGGTGIAVNVGANVTKLPAYIFITGKITSVNFATESALTSIGNAAFASCSSLTSITIPAGVTSIGDRAFSSCRGLTNITIPAGVTSIGSQAFSGCTGLTEINYNATAVGDFTSTSNVFYNAGTSGTGITVNVGANVTKLPAYMFSDVRKITSVNFATGSALTSIGGGAFANCIGLTSITLPADVTSIGDSAFSDCSSLWVINYRGTQEQWNLITKGSDWKCNCPATITYNYVG